MPLNELNKINIADWKNDPNVAVNIGKIIEKASWRKSIWEPFAGGGSDRGIRTYNVPDTEPYRPRLKTKLMGDGVRGNADLETNFDNLEILSQTIYPEVIANALLSPIKLYERSSQINFIKEATDSLTDWMVDRRDRQFVTALSNDISNCVVCDQALGFKDSSRQKDTQSASKQIVAGDVCNVKALRRAIFMARTGKNYKGQDTFPIKPIRSIAHNQGGLNVQNYSYIILLDTYQCNQLKNDPEWKEMQKVGNRGDKNNIFTGLIGLIDECPVIDMGVWTQTQSGFLNSTISDTDFYENINHKNHAKLTPPSAYADKQAVSIGFLIGASALVLAGNDTVNFYIDDTQDAGRKTICGADRILAISKARYEQDGKFLNAYNNIDFAVIGIFSSHE
ncbi:structural protein [Campylobacter sp. MIT 99-7217]|uniref:phage capsid family protein n=1 Tax=Campylobacter sp. MIT 99-7217 TaxID=535091 RepID=UPI001158F691|nr:DUF4043 family protein [Campylobacter sp. MIT 99-7217]TQR31798.1 structural protein [Campylobacter sp. MIT 99-7217]